MSEGSAQVSVGRQYLNPERNGSEEQTGAVMTPASGPLVTGAARGIGRAIAERLWQTAWASRWQICRPHRPRWTRWSRSRRPEMRPRLTVDVTDADSVEAAVAAHVGTSADWM